MNILGGRHRVTFGTSIIDYELTYTDRKTLAIHVYPDGSVVVNAPLGTQLDEIEQKVFKRAAWVLRQQRQFQDYASPTLLPRRYVSGESYNYLGRQYRLKVVENEIERVRLSRGHLTVNIANTADTDRIADLIDRWYRGHAQRVFPERLAACFPRVQSMGVEYPQLAIRVMKSRWGSCTAEGRLILNLKLIQAPKDLIDYVILHELCHLKAPNHSATFYTFLERVLPDWRERRQRLNRLELTW